MRVDSVSSPSSAPSQYIHDGRVAADLGISKGHLAVLFPSKAALEIATLDTAMARFADEVVARQIPGLIDMNVEAITGADDEIVWLENVFHPVARRLSAARGTATSIRDHGFSWDNTGRNGHFAPFRCAA